VQDMSFPEFLPERSGSLILPGSNAADRAAGVSECFGTLRYGSLLEAVLYDCRRYLNYKGAQAQVLPQPSAADWNALLGTHKQADLEHTLLVCEGPDGRLFLHREDVPAGVGEGEGLAEGKDFARAGVGGDGGWVWGAFAQAAGPRAFCSR